MASLMLVLEALFGGQHDIAIERDPAEKCRESLEGNVRDTIGDETRRLYVVYNCAWGSAAAEKEMHTWKIAQIYIWP